VRDAALELTGRPLPEAAVRRCALWRIVDLHLDRIGEAKRRGDAGLARRLMGYLSAARASARSTQQAVEAQLLREVEAEARAVRSSSSSYHSYNRNNRGSPLLLSAHGEEIRADLLRGLEAREALRFSSAPSAARPPEGASLQRRSDGDRKNETVSLGREKSAAVASRFLDVGALLPGPDTTTIGNQKSVWRTRPDAGVTDWSEREVEIGAEQAERARLDGLRLAAAKEAAEFQDALRRSSRRGGGAGGGNRRRPPSSSAAAKEAKAWNGSFERFSRRRGGGGVFGDCGGGCDGCGGGVGEGEGASDGRGGWCV
jgi:hypothetical protein